MDVVTHLQKDMDIVQFGIVVRGSFVLDDAINRTKNPTFDPIKRLMLVSLLFINAILGVYLLSCRLSSLVRKVLMLEVLLEIFMASFSKVFLCLP